MATARQEELTAAQVEAQATIMVDTTETFIQEAAIAADAMTNVADEEAITEITA